MRRTFNRVQTSATLVLGTLTLLAVAEWGLRIRYRRRSRPPASRTASQVTLVALGDSIVAGWPGPPMSAWPYLLGERLSACFPARVWRVVGAGVPGDTAAMGYARFESDVAAAGPDLVLIAFGLNDCNLARRGMDLWFERQIPRGLALRSYLWRAVLVRVGRWGQKMGLLEGPSPEPEPVAVPRTSAEGFAAALIALVDRVRTIGARPVLLTMTPIGSAMAARNPTGWGLYMRYNAVIKRCAAKVGVPLVTLSKGAPRASLLVDGVHLTARGQAWVAEQVYEQLRERCVWEAIG